MQPQTFLHSELGSIRWDEYNECFIAEMPDNKNSICLMLPEKIAEDETLLELLLTKARAFAKDKQTILRKGFSLLKKDGMPEDWSLEKCVNTLNLYEIYFYGNDKQITFSSGVVLGGDMLVYLDEIDEVVLSEAIGYLRNL